MPAKRSRSDHRSKPTVQEDETIGTIAFVLCHPNNCTLDPISEEFPICLFPLCNTPVLFYVLNWLSVHDIQMIYLLCRKEDETAIRFCVKQCQERMMIDDIHILAIESPIYSTGDAIRYIMSADEVDHRFQNCVIVPGTLVTNVPLKQLILEHEDRVTKGKKQEIKPILTTIFTQASTAGYNLIHDEEGTIVQIQNPPELDFKNLKPPLHVNPATFADHKKVFVKTGLNDTQIYICASQLLTNFTNSVAFSWHSVLADSVPYLLDNVEFQAELARAVILPDSFATTINDLPTYITASLAVIRRWLYPVTLEMNLFAPTKANSLFYQPDDEEEEEEEANSPNLKDNKDDMTAYRLKRDLVYLYDNVFPALSAQIGHSVVIGSGSEIEDDCIIQNSVIGNDCQIKKGCVITNSIIWDEVHLEEGVHIDHSIIASTAHIMKDVKIDFGSIVSMGTCVDVNLTPCTRVAQYDIPQPDEGNFRTDNPPDWLCNYIDHRLLITPGENNPDFVMYIPRPESELPLLRLWLQLHPETFPIQLSEILFRPEESQIRRHSDDDEDDEDNSSTPEDEEIVPLNETFQNQAREMLSNLLKNTSDIDQINPEYISLKNSNNAEHIDCAVALIIAIFDHYPLNHIEDGFTLFGSMLSSFLAELSVQEDMLFWLQCYCAKSPNNRQFFSPCLEIMIAHGLVSQDALDDWVNEQEDMTPEQTTLVDEYKSWASP